MTPLKPASVLGRPAAALAAFFAFWSLLLPASWWPLGAPLRPRLAVPKWVVRFWGACSPAPACTTASIRPARRHVQPHPSSLRATT
jgi:hypothetical protein